MKKKARYVPNFVIEGDGDQPHLKKKCTKAGCKETADYRAPSSRESTSYFWFCLEHVRDYNQQWDYYKGMNQQEIESHQKADMTWHRPSWPLGEGNASHFIFANRQIHDPFVALQEHDNSSSRRNSPFHPESEENKALALMDLEMPLDMKRLKTIYKILVKKYHPDHNPNDPLAEDRLKAINHAYSVLKYLIEKKI